MHNQTLDTNLFNFIKTRISILSVINEHISLKKAGYYWKGQCPFHDEKTASFTVSPHREIFYCFGCQAGGDVITFMSKIERCNQLEAAKLLADRFNIELPKEIVASQPTEQSVDAKKRYFALCEELAHWMHEQLEKHPSISAYLSRRGFSEDIINQFDVGYLPGGIRSIRSLIKDMTKKHFLSKDMIDCHFLEEGKGVTYSPFEQRVIFPIKDHLGRYCGFGGRVVKSTDQRAKYYNSRENKFFQKGSLLFGLDFAKKEIQKTKRVYLVEGYTDALAMVQYGHKNTVATLGTSCTVDHLKLLSYHAETVYLVYDGDSAGQKAMLRLAELCWQVNLELYVIFLPEGQDPADFLTEGGDLEKLAEKSEDVLSFFLNAMGEEFTNKSLQQKLEGMRKCIDIIRNLDDSLKQDILLQKAATIFGLPFSSLKDELKKSPRRVPPQNKPLPEETAPLNNPLCSLEKNFMCAILNDTGLLKKRDVTQLLGYLPPLLQGIIKKLQGRNEDDEKEKFLHFFDTLEYHERQIVNQLLVHQEKEKSDEDFESILILLEKKYWKVIVKNTKVQLAQAQQSGDTKQINSLVGTFQKIKKKLLRRGLI